MKQSKIFQTQQWGPGHPHTGAPRGDYSEIPTSRDGFHHIAEEWDQRHGAPKTLTSKASPMVLFTLTALLQWLYMAIITSINH